MMIGTLLPGCFLNRTGTGVADTGPIMDAGVTDSGEGGIMDAGDGGDGGTMDAGDGGGPALGAPVPSFQADGQLLAPTRAFLSWQDGFIPGGESVASYVSCYTTLGLTDIADPSACPNQSVDTNRFHIIDPLTPNTQYHWKVRSCQNLDGTDCSDYSAVNSLSTDNSLVAWWRFDEGTGGMAVDSSIQTNHATLMNFNPVSAWVPGVTGSALDFDGVDDFAEVLSPSFLSDTAGTITAWVKTTGSIDNSFIAGAYAGDALDWISLWMEETGELGLYDFMSPDRMSSIGDSVINDGSWHFAAYRQGAGMHELFADNTLQSLSYIFGSASDNWWFNGHPNPLTKFLIGARQQALPIGYNSFYTGQIDDVAVFDRPLTDPELFNNRCSIQVQPDCMP